MRWRTCLLVLASALLVAGSAQAGATYDLSIKGSDAIFLAGRTDVVVPPLGSPFILLRHGYVSADFVVETFPPMISVVGGDVVYVVDPAVGGINFFNGYGPPFFGPEGNTSGSSVISSLGGISGYIGTQGALAGVFLDSSVPSAGPAPATLDFSTPASRDFTTISPGLGQVFFIGDGQTSGAVAQQFIAPAGATRLFLGIPDAFGFNGGPGAYEDNDGAYRIRVGVNEVPAVPLPAASQLGVLLLAGMGVRRWLQRRAS